MTEKHGSSSMKPPEREKTSSIFAAESKGHLFAFSFAALALELYILFSEGPAALSPEALPFQVLAVFFLCCILEHIFARFVSGMAPAVFSVIPALILFFLIREQKLWPTLPIAVLTGAALRLLMAPILRRGKALLYAAPVLDLIALYLFLFEGRLRTGSLYEKLLCVCLTVLTLSAVQTLVVERNRTSFPISYFLIMGLFLCLIPMKKNPIDWTPVVRAGERLAGSIENAAGDITYFFTEAFGGSYTAGYSSLDSTGRKLESANRTQLLLETPDQPCRSYREEDSGEIRLLRKTLYLTGGRGADRVQFLRFLSFLWNNRVDKERASLFCEVSRVSLEYVYLDTKDVIAPAGSVLIEESDKQILDGVSKSTHRKGYRINALYLDLDYASPYLAELLRTPPEGVSDALQNSFTYETAGAYLKELFDMDLEDLMDETAFESALAEIGSFDAGGKEEYLDVSGASPRMEDLARELSGSTSGTYDLCRQMESYLRQYTYSRNAVGGYRKESDMSTTEGMADIADRFLFDSGSGYCVHYTSSMVMLLRLCGIPARAASGYRYPFPFERSDSYPVDSSCAHVWPEAYIEGAGWIPFEPTAAYYTLTGVSWGRKALSDFPEKEPQYDSAPLPPAVESAADSSTQEPTAREKALLAVSLFWPVAVSALLLIILLTAGTKLLSILRYRFSTPAQKLFYDVEQIKKSLIRQSGNVLQDRGLLSDFILYAPEDMRSDLQQVFSAYYRARYGDDRESPVSSGENELARSLRKKTAALRVQISQDGSPQKK